MNQKIKRHASQSPKINNTSNNSKFEKPTEKFTIPPNLHPVHQNLTKEAAKSTLVNVVVVIVISWGCWIGLWCIS